MTRADLIGWACAPRHPVPRLGASVLGLTMAQGETTGAPKLAGGSLGQFQGRTPAGPLDGSQGCQGG